MLYFLLFVFMLQAECTPSDLGPIYQVTAHFKELQLLSQ